MATATDKAEQSKAPLRIVNFQAENMKRIKVVSITPKGNVVQISGKNGQGKTSVLDAIWWALRGMNNVQVEPIRRGTESARIRLDLGEVVVTRTFGKAKEGTKSAGELTTTLTVANAEGAKFPNPQRILDSITNALAFNPLDLLDMKPRERFDVLKAFAGGVDFDAIAKANKTDFDKRTEVNRKVRDLEGRIAAIVIPEVLPTERVDEDALITEIGEVGTFNATLERRKEGRVQAAADIETKKEAAVEKRRQAATLILQAEELEGEVGTLQGKLDAAEELPQPKDAVAIQQRLNDAKANNATLDRMKTRDTLAADLAVQEAAAAALTRAMEDREADKKAKIAGAKMPIEGLGFADDDITFNDIPFDQASDAEKLRISIAIAMAANPRLRVIRVRDGNKLDEDAMKMLAQMAGDNGFQVWMELVSNNDKVGIVIEDGTVKAVNEAPEGGLL